jgi:hypothetical protein
MWTGVRIAGATDRWRRVDRSRGALRSFAKLCVVGLGEHALPLRELGAEPNDNLGEVLIKAAECSVPSAGG